MPPSGTPADLAERPERLWEFAARRDRTRDSVGLHPRVRVAPDPTVDPTGDWLEDVTAWADHDPQPAYLGVDPMGGDPAPDDHLDRLATIADALSDHGLR